MSLLAVCYQQLFFISALFHFCLLSTPALDRKVDFQVNGKSRLVSTDSFSLLLLYVLGLSTCRPSWLVKRAEQCAVCLLWCCEVDCELNTRAGNVTGKEKNVVHTIKYFWTEVVTWWVTGFNAMFLLLGDCHSRMLWTTERSANKRFFS